MRRLGYLDLARPAVLFCLFEQLLSIHIDLREPAELVGLLPQFGLCAANHQLLVEAVGLVRVPAFHPRPGYTKNTCRFLGVVGHKLCRPPGVLNGSVAVVVGYLRDSYVLLNSPGLVACGWEDLPVGFVLAEHFESSTPTGRKMAAGGSVGLEGQI